MVEPDISEEFMTSAAKAYGVTEAEKQALTLALAGLSMAEIAQRLNISHAAVRKRLGEVYRKFEIERKGPGKLAILRRKLLTAQAERPLQHQSYIDLGNAPKVNSFIGREKELQNLCQWMRRDHCDLLAITGIGGIGKTALVLELIKQVKSEFELVIWRSLRQFDSFQALLESLPDSPINATIADLFDLLAQKRCLLVLDQFDQVFGTETNPTKKSSRHPQAGVLDSHGNKHEDYQYYRQLLQKVGSSQLENSQHSCVVITSREKPRELIPFEGEHASVRILPLAGLDSQAAHHLLSDIGPLQGNDADKTQLIDSYSGNPLALKLATGTIKDLFAGHILQFLDQQQLVFDDLRDVLKEQFNRLSLLEKETMYWLAINRLPVTFASLQADIVALSHKQDLVSTLRSLEHRSLIEIRSAGAEFTLQPTVMEYVTQHLVKRVVDELSSLADQHMAEGGLLNEHSLLKADAAPSVRQQQTEKLLKPVLDALRQTYGSAIETQKKLEIFLNTHHTNAVYKTGYLGGNLVNLMAQLSKELKARKDLSHKDFSHLAIWQADLEGVTLTGTNFNHCNLEKSVFTEMLSDVVSVAFTSQSASFNALAAPYLAAGDTNGHIHIWNALTYQKRTYWQGHLGWVRSLAFNRDNTLIATGGDDSKLRLWRFHPSPDEHPSLNNISLVWEKNGFPDWVRSVAFHPDQEIVACCSHATTYLYDERTGQELARLQEHDIEPATPTSNETLRYITFSPDGSRIASCGDDTNVRVWDWQARKRLFISSAAVGHKNWARAIAFSPCGRYLISSSDDQTVRIWDLDAQICVRILRGHTDRVRSVAVSPDGGYMVSGSDDGTVILWDFQKMTQIGKSQIHGSRVWSVAFYQDNHQTLLASGGDDRSVVLSKVSPRQNRPMPPIEPIKILRGFAMGTRSVAVLPRSAHESELDLIVSGGNDWRIKLWQCSQGDPNTPIRDLAGHTGRVWSVAAHQGWVASASDDSTVRIWNLENSSCVKVLTAHQHWVRTVTFNPSGTMLASGGDDTQIHLWQLPTGIKLHTFDQHQHWIRTLAFSPDGRYLASGGDDKAIYLWDVIKGQSIRKFKQRHQHRIRSVAFRPAHSSQPAHPLLLASGSDDGKVIIWDVETGECLHCFEEQHRTAGVKSVAFSPDGCWMATGSDDHLIYVWETRTADPKTWKVKQLAMPMTIGQPLGIQSLVFMSDSCNLVSCDRSGAIHIINIIDETRRQIKPQRPYENMQIKGITGIDPVQRVSLKDLGAVDAEDLNLSLTQQHD
ncbi:wd40 repeat-containing protein [Leptolyngbya sp. Heron Island J]|uniref:NB-ARC domain-containing protein n=1 Tax=Leptolyngbya sp. Heron Island J TaxID=1385935 RepID=UPI0003B9CE02|nr:NB-ARC domain-containing protein [Leptolyngbya sp. Heron Island J]ESA34882.1 wd40 repeat-containing protein [Leptolyngbya sp. Heron Island J]